MYLRTCSNSKPTVDTAYPRAQKCSPVKFRSLPHKRATSTLQMCLAPLGSDSKEGLELRSCSGTSGERLDRGGFVLMDIEHAVQFGGFQQIEDVDRGF
jgi:hypothetical protein